ncbi:DUF1848 domain-containing protein [Veillonella sp.]|uniref:DUF1848 domain-containing protein n=1 Tax=Veillonella sp. TaxID=1926307 RepID=UPI001D8C3748|nr:DUF1848 domain-containing protein [Veillonella sp.]MBS6649126.1 DUF1848 domain-containing protein [Veillonella sp.]
MILQTGQRTDIPAFYGQWLINRVRQGFVDVLNPYNPIQITRYPINHEVVDGIAFCTKNPLPFIPLLHEINDYRQYWHMTITPYGADIETNVPQVDLVIDGFKHISTKRNPQSMVWRYDPIILTHNYTVDFHFESFYKMAKSLEGYTDTVVVSFIDIFDKVDVFKELGVNTEGCLTLDCYERAWNVKLKAPKRTPARPECNCYLHGDIGAYDTCSHFCRYCYANTNQAAVRQNCSLHDPNSSLLIGKLSKTAIIKESAEKSWIVDTHYTQDSLF